MSLEQTLKEKTDRVEEKGQEIKNTASETTEKVSNRVEEGIDKLKDSTK